MHLLPTPMKLEEGEGMFSIDYQTVISCELQKSSLFTAKVLQDAIEDRLGFRIKLDNNVMDSVIHLKRTIESYEPESYRIRIESNRIVVESSDDAGLFYGVQTLIQIIKNHKRHLPGLCITDKPVFGERGYYYDITRGKVPTLKRLKEIADTAAAYKMNQLQLYVEHTFAYKNQSEIWSQTDPLTAEEIMIFDQYCADRHIELVPSIATFGHLYEALRSKTYSHLCELEDQSDIPYNWVDRMRHHTLDVSNEASLEFVKSMIDQMLPLFRSNKFNICADETFDLGKGRNRERCKEEGTSKLYVDFLNKIISYVKDNNREVMFWGDIIIDHPEAIDEIPKDTTCLNWWYGTEYPEEKVKVITDHGFDQYLCTGICGWNHFMSLFKQSYLNIKLLTEYGKKYSVKGMLNTDWGDFGHVNLYAASKPGLLYGAQFFWHGEARSFEEMNTTIDYLEFGIEKELVSELVKVSQAQALNWGTVICWLHDNDMEPLSKIEVSAETVLYNIATVTEVEEKLLDLMAEVPIEKREDLYALYVLAGGVRLFNHLLPILQHYLLGKERDMAKIMAHKELAEALEFWLVEYKKCWNLNNKSSELYRIVETVRMLCGKLREF